MDRTTNPIYSILTMKNLLFILILFCSFQGFGQIKGYWKLNANANDFSGNSLNGSNTYGTANYSGGYLNTAASLAGIEVADNVLLNPSSSNFYVSVWFKTSSSLAKERYILTKYGSDGYNCYMVRMNPTHKIFYFFRDGSDNAISFTTTAAYNDGKWHHCVSAKIGTTLYAYMDGVLLGTNTNTSIGIMNTNSKMGIGYYMNPNNTWYQAPGDGLQWVGGIKNLVIGKDFAVTNAFVKNQYAYGKGFF